MVSSRYVVVDFSELLNRWLKEGSFVDLDSGVVLSSFFFNLPNPTTQMKIANIPTILKRKI